MGWEEDKKGKKKVSLVSSTEKEQLCGGGREQQKMKQIIGDLTRGKMKQKKAKENQSSRK